MVTKTLPWNSAELLRDKDDIAAYLEAALEEAFATRDVSAFTRALEVVAKSHGMKKIADEAGLGRESLYKSLAVSGNPGFATVFAVLRTLGIRMGASPMRATETEHV
jgi:probable addiction module antidote protein